MSGQTKDETAGGTGELQTTGQTNTTDAPPSKTGNAPNNDPGTLNDSTRVGYLFQMSLLVFLYLALSSFYTYLISVRAYAIFYKKTYDQIEEDEDTLAYYNRFVANVNMNMLAYLFLSIGIICNMYYYSHFSSGNSGNGGTLGRLAPMFSLGENGIKILNMVIIVLYILSLLLILSAHFLYLYYSYDDEDNPTYSEDFYKDTRLNAFKAIDWAEFFPRPLFIVIILLQHVKPEVFLSIFEWRLFLYSFVLTITFFIWTLFYCIEPWYKWYVSTTYEDEENAAFSAASVFSVITLLCSIGVLAWSGFQLSLFGFGLNGGFGSAGIPSVYQIYFLSAGLLFISMSIFSICAAAANWDSDIMLCWICVLMIFIDVT